MMDRDAVLWKQFCEKMVPDRKELDRLAALCCQWWPEDTGLSQWTFRSADGQYLLV